MEVKVTKEEILSHSNDYELGKLVRQRYWSLHEEEIFNNSDEHIGLLIGALAFTLTIYLGLLKVVKLI